MNSAQRSFDQVKNILGKLDRNIDAARQRRLQTGPPAPIAAAQPAPIPAPTPAPSRPAFNSPTPAPMPTFSSVTPSRSIYGRAQPLRPENRQPRTGS